MPAHVEAAGRTALINIRGVIAADGAVALRFGTPPRHSKASAAGISRVADDGIALRVQQKDRVLATWHPQLIDPTNALFRGPLPAGRPLAFQVRIPVAAAADRIVVWLHGTPGAELALPDEPPEFDSDPRAVLANDKLVVSWGMRGAARERLFFVRASADGEVWTTLAAHVQRPGVEIPASRLPGGARLQLAVEATDGLHRAERRTAIDGLQPAAPDIVMLQPPPGLTHVAGRPVRLEAVAALRGARLDPADVEFRWTIDDEEVGADAFALWQKPTAGEHRVTVRVRYRREEVRASRAIVVKPPTAKDGRDT